MASGLSRAVVPSMIMLIICGAAYAAVEGGQNAPRPPWSLHSWVHWWNADPNAALIAMFTAAGNAAALYFGAFSIFWSKAAKNAEDRHFARLSKLENMLGGKIDAVDEKIDRVGADTSESRIMLQRLLQDSRAQIDPSDGLIKLLKIARGIDNSPDAKFTAKDNLVGIEFPDKYMSIKSIDLLDQLYLSNLSNKVDLDDDSRIFLIEDAKAASESRFAKTFLLLSTNTDPAELVGFFTICLSSVHIGQVPKEEYRYSDGLLITEIPDGGIDAYTCMKIARIFISTPYRGRGYGEFLLSYSVRIAIAINTLVGCRLIIASTNYESWPFFKKCGFFSLESKDRAGEWPRLVFFNLKVAEDYLDALPPSSQSGINRDSNVGSSTSASK